MRKTWIRLLIVTLPFSGSLCASILQDLRAAIAESAPFTADFKQELFRDGQIELAETGFFLYQSPQKMKWEYRDPELKVFVVNDQLVKFYNPQDNQLTVGDLKKQQTQWIWQMLMNDQIGVTVEENLLQRTITLRCQDEELEFEVHVGGNGLPGSVVQIDALGYESRYHFSGYRLQVKTVPADFELKVPQDVEIIEME